MTNLKLIIKSQMPGKSQIANLKKIIKLQASNRLQASNPASVGLAICTCFGNYLALGYWKLFGI